MDVILMQDVENLGSIGDLVKVRPGYGRNYLLPKKLAVVASIKSKSRLEHEKRMANFALAKARADDESTIARLAGLTVELARKVGEQDKLYGSVTTLDIEHALEEKGFHISRRKIELTDSIRALGSYEVPVRLRADLKAKIKVEVVAEE